MSETKRLAIIANMELEVLVQQNCTLFHVSNLIMEWRCQISWICLLFATTWLLLKKRRQKGRTRNLDFKEDEQKINSKN